MARKLPKIVSEMTDEELLRVVGQGTDGIRIVLTEKASKRIPEAIVVYKTLISSGDRLLMAFRPNSEGEISQAKQWNETTENIRESLKYITL